MSDSTPHQPGGQPPAGSGGSGSPGPTPSSTPAQGPTPGNAAAGPNPGHPTAPGGPAHGPGGAPAAPYAPQGQPKKSGNGARTGIIAAIVGVVVIALVGVGAWAYQSLSGGGQQATDVLPGTAVMSVSVDLNPDLYKKAQAKEFIDKFPSVKSQMESDGYDPRKWIWQEASKNSSNAPSWDELKTWVGNRAGFAVIPGENKPELVAVLQVTDVNKAKESINKGIEQNKPSFGGATRSTVPGMADEGEWLYVAFDETQDAATKVAEKSRDTAKDNSLSSNEAYKQDMKAVDGSVATMWIDAPGSYEEIEKASKAAGPMGIPGLSGAQMAQKPSGHGAIGLRFGDGGSAEIVGSANDVQDMTKYGDGKKAAEVNLPDNTAAMMAVSDLGPRVQAAWPELMKVVEPLMSLAASSSQLGTTPPAPGATPVPRVPGMPSTAVPGAPPAPGAPGTAGAPTTPGRATAPAPGVATTQPVSALPVSLSSLARTPAETEAQLEQMTGLTLPEDVVTLLGDQTAGALFVNGKDFTGGVRVKTSGDHENVFKKLDPLLQASNTKLERKPIDGGYVAASDTAAADALAAGGNLSDKEAFKKAVPQAGKAAVVAYVDIAAIFDASGSKETMSEEDRQMVEPLQSLGMATWAESDTSVAFQLKLTTR